MCVCAEVWCSIEQEKETFPVHPLSHLESVNLFGMSSAITHPSMCHTKVMVCSFAPWVAQFNQLVGQSVSWLVSG